MLLRHEVPGQCSVRPGVGQVERGAADLVEPHGTVTLLTLRVEEVLPGLGLLPRDALLQVLAVRIVLLKSGHTKYRAQKVSKKYRSTQKRIAYRISATF